MNLLLVLAVTFFFSVGMAYAEPFDDLKTNVTFGDNSTSVHVSWNNDQKSAKYELGCVSCIPNISKFTTSDSIMLDGITPISNRSLAILYVISYDLENEIVSAKQLFVDFD